MRATLPQYIEHLRSKDEPTRRKWLILMSVGSMLIVVGLWVQYVRSFVIANDTEAMTSAQTRPGFAAVFKTGLGVLSEKGKGFAETIRKRLKKEHSIVIQNPSRNFIVEDLDASATNNFLTP